MPSFKSAAVVVLGLITLAAPQAIDPNSVDPTTRKIWCTTQEASCPILCDQVKGSTGYPTENNCDPATLIYSCVCNNGLSPNASEYSQTIPYFECTTFNDQCAKNCGTNNNACVTACRTSHPCGAQNPTRVNLTTVTTSSMTSTATGTATGSGSANVADATGFAGPAATTPASGGNAGQAAASSAALGFEHTYGLGLVFLGVFAGFAVLL